VIGFLTHLNGTLAASLLCALLFVDEVGVPLPFAPNEVLLLFAGLLLASGVLLPWLFLPLALIAMVSGMVTGFVWARTVGSDRLHDLAAVVDAERPYDRAVHRVRSASLGGIAISRLLPGVRVYATLAAGSSGIRLRRFLVGAVPALLVWLGVLVLVGVVVGRPAERLISRVDSLIVTGAFMIVVGVGAFLVVRHVPRARIEEDRMSTVPRSLRVVLALAVDLGIVAAVITGVAGLGGTFFHLLREVNGVVGLSLLVVVAYVLAARRGGGATLGEGLFTVDFRSLLRIRRHGGHSKGNAATEGDELRSSGT